MTLAQSPNIKNHRTTDLTQGCRLVAMFAPAALVSAYLKSTSTPMGAFRKSSPRCRAVLVLFASAWC